MRPTNVDNVDNDLQVTYKQQPTKRRSDLHRCASV
jgi:hypothetical protein